MNGFPYSAGDLTSSALASGPTSVPFAQDQQLDWSLTLVDNKICHTRGRSEFAQTAYETPSLPGYPTKYLYATTESDQRLVKFMRDQFETPRLDEFAPRLWLVATLGHHNISPIHEQLRRGRRLVLTEKPELHLTWIDDRVYIKPIPAYLTSYAFWDRYLGPLPQAPFEKTTQHVLLPAILGFLRSWTYLVQHESDFKLAKDAYLVPEDVTYTKFMKFIANFEGTEENLRVVDSMVSPRYRFGQLRLSRLNRWSKVFTGKRFEKVYWQYWQYFQTIFGPLLFIFAMLSLVLSAMQVGMTDSNIWPAYAHVGVWFSVVTLLSVTIIIGFLVGLFLTKGLRELIFALRALARKKKKKSASLDT